MMFFVLLIAFASAIPDPTHLKCKDLFYNSFIPDGMLSTDTGLCKNDSLAMSYNGDLLNPSWTAHFLTAKEAHSAQGGRRSFMQDEDLAALGVHQVSSDDKIFSEKWTRGHLAPSRDMSYDKSTNGPWYNAYKMSNIAVQTGVFNTGSWNNLETNIFNWINSNNQDLYIVTGTMLKDKNNPNRMNGITVPDYYFKIICDPTHKQSAGFYGRNTQDNTDHLPSMVSVHEIEGMFGGNLMDTACNTDTVDSSHWNFK